MAYVYQPWPAWCHGPKGESAIFNSEDELPKGWAHPRKPKEPKAPVAAEGKEELDGLRAEYKKVTGKKPFMGWSADQLREKLHEAEAK